MTAERSSCCNLTCVEQICDSTHQPGIVSESLVGVLMGASVLGWIGPNDNRAFLAERRETRAWNRRVNGARVKINWTFD